MAVQVRRLWDVNGDFCSSVEGLRSSRLGRLGKLGRLGRLRRDEGLEGLEGLGCMEAWKA